MTTSAKAPAFRLAAKSRLLLSACLAAMMPAAASAASQLVCSGSDLSAAVNGASAGDEIVLCNKEWKNTVIKLKGNGTATNPIVLRAESAGKAILTGQSYVEMGGSHVVVDGLVFRNGYSPTDYVVKFNSGGSDCQNCRLTNSAIIDYYPPKGTSGYRDQRNWIDLDGTNNRVDHNYFSGKDGKGPLMTVLAGSNAYPVIERNYFGDRPRYDEGNYGEMIKIGSGDTTPIKATVKDNFFYKADGEIEIVSNKSSGNRYIHNTFDSSRGLLVLRQGYNVEVLNNFFFGRGIADTGGIRVTGKNHLIRNNYIDNVEGFQGAIHLHSGKSNYNPAQDVTVAHNTVTRSKYSLVFGDDGWATPPDGITVVGNIIETSGDEAVTVRHSPKNVNYTSNIFHGGPLGIGSQSGIIEQDPQLGLDAEGIYRPAGNSPAIGASRYSGDLLDDMDMQPRPASLDIGADQFGGNSVLRQAPVGRCDVGPLTYDPSGSCGTKAPAMPGGIQVTSN